jgi:hypothetical protein
MVDHLSFSSITTYLSCPRSWKFKYIEDQPKKTSTALAFGSAFHETVEKYVLRTEETDIKALWTTAWGNQAKKVTLDEGDTFEGMQNEGIRMFTSPKVLYEINAIQPPREIEFAVKLTVPGVPVPIIGYIDIIGQDGIPGDFKTSSKRWGDDKAANSLQPLFYLAALNQMGIQTPMKFRHYVFIKTKEPNTQLIETDFKPANVLFLFSLVQNVWKSISADAFHENPDGWLCSETYCDFWKLCKGRFV